MMVLNFALFVLIAVGQCLIYWTVRTSSMGTTASGSGTGSSNARRSQDMTIARRLFTIVLSDFLCWFPIGLLGQCCVSSS